MPDDFDRITGDFFLSEDQKERINEAAAIHAAYFWRLVTTHGVPHIQAQAFTEVFIDKACQEDD